jgi:acyl-CoA hydrolase
LGGGHKRRIIGGAKSISNCEVIIRMPKNVNSGNSGIPSDASAASHAGLAVSASRSEMTEVVLPQDANPLGFILGGRVMHLMDIAAAIAAHRHSRSHVVTASVDYVDFRNSIRVGELIVLKSSVNRVFNTSLEVGVKIFSENFLSGERRHTTSAYVTFVAIDENRQPRSIRPLILETDEDRRRFAEAAQRREIRLAHRFKRGR